MRFVLLTLFAVFGLTACDSSGNNESPCPKQLTLSCGAELEGQTCDFETASGSASCRCENGQFTCNDCPDGEPIGACGAGQSCAVWGFENSCACSCDANGQWSCVADDPDPNVHCSP